MKKAKIKELPSAARQALVDAYKPQVDENARVETNPQPDLTNLVVRIRRDLDRKGADIEEGNETVHAIFGMDTPEEKEKKKKVTGTIISRVSRD